MLPSRNDMHPVDVLLTGYAIGYGQDRSKDFIAAKVGYQKKVTKRSGRYTIWDKGDRYRSEMQMVGPNDPAPEAGFRMSTDTYFCDDYKLKKFVGDEDRDDADVDLRLASVEYLIDQALLKRDLIVAATVFGTGLWTGITEETGVTGTPSTNQFKRWDESGSVPLKDVSDAKESVRVSCGNAANVMVTSNQVINALMTNSNILARYQYTQGGSVSLADLEKLFGLQIVVGGSVQNTAKEGATATLADVWGKHALFLYVDPASNSQKPNAITTFSYAKYDKMTPDSAAIKSWRIEDPDGEWLRVEAAYDCKITAQDAGVFHYTVVS